MTAYMYKKKYRGLAREILKDALGGECVDCGTEDDLTFDHVFPETKVFDISQRLDTKVELLYEELQKCQLLCRSCHGVKTQLDMGNQRATHGTISMYNNYKCRCADCTSANTRYYRARRFATGAI